MARNTLTENVIDSDYMIRHVAVSDSAQFFIGAMSEAASWNLTNVMEFLEKPWKWANEYGAWARCGSPRDSDHVAFEDFLTELEKLQ